jgi:uncharacterized protein (TIGR03067 family)
MQWFRMMGGLVAGILVVANALSVRGGDPGAIRAQQAQTQSTANLEGRWIVVSHTVDGDEQDPAGTKVHIAKGKFTVKEANGDVQKATYKVDTTTKPHQIDMTASEGVQKDQVFKGIFILKGARLTLCLARPDSDRPTEPTAKEGSGHMLFVLEPAKSEQ